MLSEYATGATKKKVNWITVATNHQNHGRWFSKNYSLKWKQKNRRKAEQLPKLHIRELENEQIKFAFPRKQKEWRWSNENEK